MNIFEYRDYKSFLIDQQHNRHGFLAACARAAKTPPSTLTRALRRPDSNLSLDQAYSISQYLGHQDFESRYFMLLVEHEKASSQELKSFIESQLQELRNTKVLPD